MNNSVKETRKYLVFDYVDTYEFNNLLNEWYMNDRLIIMDKKQDSIVVKLEKQDYSLNDSQALLNDDLDRIIDLLDISNGLRFNIRKNDIKLYANNYINIFDNLLLKENNYYLFNISREKEIYQEISKYNKYYDMISDNEIKIIDNYVFEDIENMINDRVEDIFIVNNKDRINLYIKGDYNYLFVFKDRVMFNNIYFPELVKLYGINNGLDRFIKDKQFNLYHCCINDNFYLINFSEDEVLWCENYLKSIDEKNKRNSELSENYNFIKDISPTYNYSYGYVSIILISFIISIITIIVVFMRL